MGLRADFVEGIGRMWYCSTHQTLQAKKVCMKCREQDGTGLNAEAIRIKKTKKIYERREAWSKMAQRINGGIIEKYDRK